MKANEADFYAKKLNKAMYFMVPSFVFFDMLLCSAAMLSNKS